MKLYASWAHGNALTVESPQVLSANEYGHAGWGADFVIQSGQSSWFHIPIPTPVIVADVRAQFTNFFLLFDIPGGGRITELHIYDGTSKIQEFKGLDLTGVHRDELDGLNSFHLSAPYSVLWGIGISFTFTADVASDPSISPSRLMIASAGVDFYA